MNARPVLAERAALCDLMVELGPDAPTWNEGWTTADLAAHLLTRENRPDVLPGLVAGGAAARHTETVRREALKQPYAKVVQGLRNGPPWFWAAKWIPVMDVHEWYVHHEDVRRPNGGEPRDLSPDLEAQLWSLIDRFGRSLTRKLDIGIDVTNSEGQTKSIRSGTGHVTLSGPTGELFLYLFGRPVNVEITGDDIAVATLKKARLSA